ncbi:MAG: amino acid permease [Candidatus Thermoplasmatota archaeon]|nr:amino acid permease [Candidatus Thermoplasmatota archaeon]MCL5789139.1 amino acid permease [Candidatus Thermoplasmatota archaeon]
MQSSEESNKLRKGAIGIWQGIFQSVSYIAPAGDVAILLVGTFAFALQFSTISVILGWLIYGIMMIVPYKFSKKLATAGSYYSYAASSGDGGIWGIMTELPWFFDQFTGESFAILGLASFIALIFPSVFYYVWVPIAIFVALFGLVLPYLGIKLSLNYALYTGMAEILFLIIGAVIVILRVGSSHLSVQPFTIPAALIGPIMFGTIFSIVDFIGLGSVTTTSEEITKPRKHIRNSLFFAWLLAGVTLIPATYALTVGWGIGNIASYAVSPDPGLIVFGKFLGPIGAGLMIIFTANSYLDYSVAKVNATNRVWYTMAKNKFVFPRFMSKLNKHGVPGNSMIVNTSVILILSLIAGFILGPAYGALVFLTAIGIGSIFVHLFMNVAFIRFTQKNKTRESLVNYAASIGGIIAALAIITVSSYSTVTTYFASPSVLNAAYMGAVIFALIWSAVIGPIFAIYLKHRKSDVLKNSALVPSDVEED